LGVRQQFKQNISIKNNQQKLEFLNKYLVIIQILQFVGGMYWQHHYTKAKNSRQNIPNEGGRL
jgi:hypothetical protein